MLSGYLRKGSQKKILFGISVFIYLGLVYKAIEWSQIFNSKAKTETILMHFPKQFPLPKVNEDKIFDLDINHHENSDVQVLDTGQRSSDDQNLKPENYRSAAYKYFTKEFPVNQEPVMSWVKNEKVYCDNRLSVFGDRFAVGQGVKMFPLRRIGYENQAKGGEEVRFVLHQQLTKEDYLFNTNFWEMECSQSLSLNTYSFYWGKNIHLQQVISKENKTENHTLLNIETKYTIGVRRQDYANLHNWVRDIYNTFIVMLHLNLQPSQVSILFLDGHPFTYLDHAWETIYSKPIRVGHLNQTVTYDTFIWGIQENQGPITEPTAQNTVPYLEEFRSFVLNQHNLSSEHKLDCAKPRITFIIRRNAVYHPRNVEGNVGRKIFNEAEIVDAIMKKFPHARVHTVLMESVPMVSQLHVSSTTDIWIGMHGAGMSHTIFLPKHAGVLELFAKDFKSGRPWFKCFHEITNWRGMSYETWENMDSTLEMPHDFTIVPPDIVVSKVEVLLNRICPKQF